MGVSIRRLPQRGNDYYIFIRANGHRSARRIGPDKKEAEAIAAEVRRDLILGKHVVTTKPRKSADSIRLSTYFEQWLNGYAKLNCKTSTYTGYLLAWTRYIKPAFGNKTLSEIDRPMVRALAETLLATKSRSYAKITLAPLSAVFNRAVEDGLLTNNPMLRILPKARGDQKRNVRALTKDELRQLLTVGQETYPAFFPFVLLMAMTGLRIGEAVALRPQDVHLEQRYLSVVENFVDGYITTPKSRKPRRVDIGSVLVNVLRSYLPTLPADAPRLFLSTRGKMIHPDNWRNRHWRQITAQAGLPRLNLKDLRHTFASLLIQQGAPLAYIKEQMGHHSISITADIYGHLVPGGHQAEMEKLGEGLLPVPRS